MRQKSQCSAGIVADGYGGLCYALARMAQPQCRLVLQRFARAQQGVTAVEFALVAPVLLLLVMGIVEFALVMLAYNVMESATNMSARLGATGFTASGISRQQTILDAVRARAGSFIDPDRVEVHSRFYSQYDQINEPEPFTDSNHNGLRDSGEPYTDVNGNGQWDADMAVAGYGNAGDVVVYTVQYPWAIATPIISHLVGTDGVYMITTHAVVKNEPF